MTSVLPPLNGQANFLDERSRLQLQDSLRGAAQNTETANDTMLRLFNANLEVSVVKIGCDLGIFRTLVASNDPISVDQFASKTGADSLLLERILRYLASLKIVTETGKAEYTANQTTRTLADPSIEGSISYM